MIPLKLNWSVFKIIYIVFPINKMVSLPVQEEPTCFSKGSRYDASCIALSHFLFSQLNRKQHITQMKGQSQHTDKQPITSHR